VIDENFQSVANLLSIRPDVVRSSPNTPLKRRQYFNVSWKEGISTQENNVMAIEMADKVVLVDWGPTRWKWNMTLGSSHLARTITGYYNGSQARQIVWIR